MSAEHPYLYYGKSTFRYFVCYKCYVVYYVYYWLHWYSLLGRLDLQIEPIRLCWTSISDFCLFVQCAVCSVIFTVKIPQDLKPHNFWITVVHGKCSLWKFQDIFKFWPPMCHSKLKDNCDLLVKRILKCSTTIAHKIPRFLHISCIHEN